MSRARFYRLALWLPLVAPLPFLGLGLLAPDLFVVPAVLLGGSLVYAAPTYPLFAALVYWRLRRRPLASWERTSLWLPLAYAPFCGLGVAALYSLLAETRSLSALISGAGDVALVALAFGYGYVGVVHLVAARLPYTQEPA